jgi:ribonuclease HI
MGKQKKISCNNMQYIKICQSKQNIYQELELLINRNEIVDNFNELPVDEWIYMSKQNEKVREIKSLIKCGIKQQELINIYVTNEISNLKDYTFYTDGSLLQKHQSSQIDMGLAWIQVENENSNQIISSFKASNYGWPSSTKAEVLAIYTALLAVVADSHVKIYTDSAVAISQYNSFKNTRSERKKGKINQKNIWEVIFGLIKKYNLKVELFKVQAHTGIWGNEKADILAKEGVDDFRILTNNTISNSPYHLSWYGIEVQQNDRKFVKKLNIIRNEINVDKLKRMKDLNENTDKKLSFSILRENREKEDFDNNNKRPLSLRGNRFKSFKFRKMIGELPTLEKLKQRMPKIYKEHWQCPRCNCKSEDTRHLWECVKARNEVISMERHCKEELDNLIRFNDNFELKDNLMEAVYKYTRTEITLKDMNHQANTAIYKRLGVFNKRLTYVWDGKGSLDDILLGWIPKDLVNIFLKFQKKTSRSDIYRIIISWVNYVNRFLYDNIWKERNVVMMDWEKHHAISFMEKRNKSEKKKTIRERNKRMLTGKRKLYQHVVDEEFYERVKLTIGMKFFHKSQNMKANGAIVRLTLFYEFTLSEFLCTAHGSIRL